MGIDYVGADVSRMLAGGQHAQAITRLARAVDKMQGEALQLSPAGRRSQASQASDLPQVVLGMNDTSVAATTTDTVTQAPNTTIRITDFFVRDAVADDFLITQLQPGRLDLLVGGSAPASMFRSSVQRPPLEAPYIKSGTNITVGAQNLLGAARRFDAGFPGLDLERQYDVTAPVGAC